MQKKQIKYLLFQEEAMEITKKIIVYIFTIFMLSLAVFLSFNRGITYFSSNIDLLTIVPINFLKQFAEIILLIIFLIIIYKFVINGSKRTTRILLTMGFIINLTWVVNFPVTYYFDMNSIMNNANYFLGKDGYDIFYLTFYPFNNTMTLLVSLYRTFFNVEMAFMLGRVVNVILMFIIEITVYQIVSDIYNSKQANFTLFVMIIFFPLTGYLVVVYNDIISLVLLIRATYHFLRLLKNYNNKDFILVVLLLIIANLFRSITILFVIAFCLYYLIIKREKAIKFIIIIVVSLLVLTNVSNLFYKNIYNLEMNNSIPLNHYILMGMENGSDNNSPGYYLTLMEDYAYLYGSENFDSNKYQKYIDIRLENKMDNMSYMDYLSHYSYKYLFQWSSGTFETNMINNLIDNKEDSPIDFYYKTNIQKYVTNNIYVYSIINLLSYLMWYLFILIISMNLLIDIIRKKVDFKLLIFQIIILGFIGFYIIMETSPHYLFIILPFMIIIFVSCFENLINIIEKRLK
jgi:hypothetical protein